MCCHVAFSLYYPSIIVKEWYLPSRFRCFRTCSTVNSTPLSVWIGPLPSLLILYSSGWCKYGTVRSMWIVIDNQYLDSEINWNSTPTMEWKEKRFSIFELLLLQGFVHLEFLATMNILFDISALRFPRKFPQKVEDFGSTKTFPQLNYHDLFQADFWSIFLRHKFKFHGKKTSSLSIEYFKIILSLFIFFVPLVGHFSCSALYMEPNVWWDG